MAQDYPLEHEGVAGEAFFDGIQELSSGAAWLRITIPSASTVRVEAGPGHDQAAVALGTGLTPPDFGYRWKSANTTIAHPGGAAGVYDLVLTAASANDFTGAPPNEDQTARAFGMALVATGVAPAGVALYRKVAEIDWDGAKITGLRQLVGLGRATDPLSPRAPQPAVPPLTVTGFAAQTAPLVQVGSAAATPKDRLELTPAGMLKLPAQGVTAGVELGGDVNLYRSGSNVLKTDDVLDISGSSAFGALRLSSAAATPAIVIGGDVNLSRPAASILQADSLVKSARAAAASFGFAVQVTGDVRDRWRLDATGKQEWGDGAAAHDTNLYRHSADILGTDDRFHVTRSVVGDIGLSTRIAADAANRWQVTAGGVLGFGEGVGAPDVNLYRSAANVLRTDDAFVTGTLAGATVASAGVGVWIDDGGSMTTKRGAATDPFLVASWTGNTVNPFVGFSDGKLEWGSGAAARDANLYRAAADVLKTDDRFQAGNGLWAVFTPYVAGASAFRSVVSGEGNYRWNVEADGRTSWGAGGATAPDVNLYRAAADQLKTDDRFIAAGGVFVDVAGANPALASIRTAGQLIARSWLGSGDAQPAFQIAGDGQMHWGAGGATAPDTTLYRSAADTLKTDDAFHVAAAFRHLGGSLGFFNAPAVGQRSGWGAALATNFAGVAARRSLPADATLNHMREAFATLVDDVGRAYGLLGA